LRADETFGVIILSLDLHVGRRDDLLAGGTLESRDLAVAIGADGRILVAFEALVEESGAAHKADETFFVPQLFEGRNAVETHGDAASSAAALGGGAGLGIGRRDTTVFALRSGETTREGGGEICGSLRGNGRDNGLSTRTAEFTSNDRTSTVSTKLDA